MRIFILFSQSVRKVIYESISYTINKEGYHVLTSSIIYVLLKISIKTKHKNIFFLTITYLPLTNSLAPKSHINFN